MESIKDYEQIVNNITVKDIQKFTDDFQAEEWIEVSVGPETLTKNKRPYTEGWNLFDERQRSFYTNSIYKYYESDNLDLRKHELQQKNRRNPMYESKFGKFWMYFMFVFWAGYLIFFLVTFAFAFDGGAAETIT